MRYMMLNTKGWKQSLINRLGVPYARSLSPFEVLRIRLWGAATSYTEARWLEANGWRRTRGGWLLPDWHPHKNQARLDKSGLRRFDDVSLEPQIRKEPYTQSHAANSQRAHCARGTIQGSNDKQPQAPPFPSYRWEPYAATVNVAALFVMTTAFTFNTRQTHTLFVLASSLLFCVSLFISHRARRAWELDWAETRLMRRSPHEIQEVHRSH